MKCNYEVVQYIVYIASAFYSYTCILSIWLLIYESNCYHPVLHASNPKSSQRVNIFSLHPKRVEVKACDPICTEPKMRFFLIQPRLFLFCVVSSINKLIYRP